MRIYIAGCGGMLGEAMFRELRGEHTLKCTDIDLNDDWLEKCDFRDFAQYDESVSSFRPDILFHLGAHTNLEYCESNPDDAYLTNTLSVEHGATIVRKLSIPLLYISTAGVFDGKKGLYDDWDAPNPLGVYARSKYLAEVLVQQRVERHFICRAGWMMGGGPKKDKKFVGKIMSQLASGATVLHVVDDKLGTPTYTVDFARNVNELVKTQYYGLYNMVCGGDTNRLEIAHHLLAILGLSETVQIRAVGSDYFSKEFFALRPASEGLINYKLGLRGLNRMRDWRSALEEYVCDYYASSVGTFAPNYKPMPKEHLSAVGSDSGEE